MRKKLLLPIIFIAFGFSNNVNAVNGENPSVSKTVNNIRMKEAESKTAAANLHYGVYKYSEGEHKSPFVDNRKYFHSETRYNFLFLDKNTGSKQKTVKASEKAAIKA
jgi:hypothetical protein